ncbi:unnamed protein product [Sphenostylis stenocarpa]|uniref:Uncharacterized protein n=1 Tax=Sphenostylis stenocarpa TaxID=92480 RepID=A0AA86W375_9FABA|nr:unnamed protein product [Sphenostylis stenocarpa]
MIVMDFASFILPTALSYSSERPFESLQILTPVLFRVETPKPTQASIFVPLLLPCHPRINK